MLLLFVGKNGKSFCQRLIDYQYVGLSFDTMAKAKVWLLQRGTETNMPFAIICDLQLPDGNAFDLCRHAQDYKQTSDLIFIVVAKNFIQADKERATELGIDAYFSYPPMGREIDLSIRSIRQVKQIQSGQLPQNQSTNSFLALIRNLLATH